MSLDPVIIVSWAPPTQRGATAPLPDTVRDRIISLKYTDKARGADKFSLSIDNSDLSLFDDPRFAEGNRLYVQWGYPNELTPVHVVTIKKVKGWRKLSVEGEHSGELLAISSQQTRSFENSTEWEVAESLAREMGYSSTDSRVIEPPSDAERRLISQAGETNMAFLMRLADRVDHRFYIKGGKFHFHPPRTDQTPGLTLTYWDDNEGVFAGEPSVTAGTLGIPGRVSRRGYSPRSRSAVNTTAGNEDDTDRPVLGEQSPVRDPGEGSDSSESDRACRSSRADDDYLYRWFQGRENQSVDDRPQNEVSATTDSSEGQGRRRAQARFRRAEREAIQMQLPLIGMPTLTADMTVRLEGVGEKLTGNYLVEEVSHSVGTGGYKCQAKVKRNATSTSSAGARRNRTTNRQTATRLRTQIQRLNQQYAAGRIDRATYDSRWSSYTLRLRQLESGEDGPGGSESRGRQNTAEGRDSEELEQRTSTNPDTGGRQVSYDRRGAEQDDLFEWERPPEDMTMMEND